VGSTGAQASLIVTNAAAGFGTAGTETGTVVLENNALLEFASGQITTINGELFLDGKNALVADSGATMTNSALTGLTSVAGEFFLANGAAVSPSGNLGITSAGLAELDGPSTGGSGGTNLTIAGALTNSGTLFIGNSGITAADTVTVQGAGGLVNSGAITLQGGGSTTATANLTVSGNLSNTGTVVLDAYPYYGPGGRTLTVGGTLTNSGTLDIGNSGITAADTVTVQGAGGLSNAGAINLQGSTTATANLTVTGTATTSGTVVVGSNADLTAPSVNVTGGVLEGAGTVTGALNNNGGGTVAGGSLSSTPGTLTVSGTYDQSGTGILQADINTSDPQQSSIVSVTGSVDLGGGTLLVDAETPLALNTPYTVMSFGAGQLSGLFSQVQTEGALGNHTGNGNSVNLGSGDTLDVIYNGASGDVQVDITEGTKPTITGVTETPSSGVLGVGGAVVIALTTSEAVTVSGGTPLVMVDDGGVAQYDPAASTPTSLVFDYVVQPGQLSVAALSVLGLNANGATVADAMGSTLDPSLTSLTQIGPQIDAGPTLSGAGNTVSFDQGGVPIAIDPAINVADLASQTLTGATVTITTGFLAGDVLAAATAGTNVVASYDGAGALTLTGSDTLANYQNVLRSVIFDSTSSNPANEGVDPSRTITWQASDGISSSNEVSTTVTVVPTQPADLVVNGGSVTDTIVQGQPDLLTFTLTNIGQDTASNATLSLPGISWLTSASPLDLGNIAAGQSVTVSLMANAGSTAALGNYQGNFEFDYTDNGAAESTAVPFDFTLASSALGGIDVRLTDEETYYSSSAPLVQNANVVLTDLATQTIVANPQNVNGIFDLGGLKAGNYQLQISAPDHFAYSQDVTVQPGTTTTFDAFLPENAYSFQWTVVPSTVEDQYQIQLTGTFETDIPVPVMDFNPNPLEFSTLAPGQSEVINATITDKGLIAGDNLTLNLPNPAGFVISPQVTSIPVLAEGASIVDPITITRDASGSTGGPNGGDLTYDYVEVEGADVSTILETVPRYARKLVTA
jgi:hypothetical protein